MFDTWYGMATQTSKGSLLDGVMVDWERDSKRMGIPTSLCAVVRPGKVWVTVTTCNPRLAWWGSGVLP